MAKKLFRIARSRTGLGLFATAEIKKGAFIAEYKGRRIRNAEADRRPNRYMFEINNRWTLDGATRRNLARYANHSCRPNAESDVKKHKVFLTAKRKIQPGEEITYDYGKDYFDSYLKPVGCRCDKCRERRRLERSATRRKLRRARERAQRVAAGTRRKKRAAHVARPARQARR